MDPQIRDSVVVIGRSVLGATIVLGGAFYLLESASRRNALKLNVEASMNPIDRDLLRSLVQQVHVVSSELSSSLDRITDHGVDINVHPFGSKRSTR